MTVMTGTGHIALQGIQRWTFLDSYANERSEPVEWKRSWMLPHNPREMTSPYSDRAVTARMNVAGNRPVLYEGGRQPKEWQFSGVIHTHDEFVKMKWWLIDRNKDFAIRDHFARRILFFPTVFDVRPKRNIARYWSHEYTVSGLVTDVSLANVTRDYYQ